MRKIGSQKHMITLIILLFSIDQVTKYLASQFISLDDVLFSFYGFGLTYTINKGLVLSIGEQYGFTIIISGLIKIIIIPLVILFYRFYKTYFRESTYLNIFYVFMLAGTLGNLCDQLIFGFVRDFLLWPGPGTPNLADLFAYFSIINLLIELFKNPQIDNKSLFKIRSLRKELESIQKFIVFAKKEMRLFPKQIKRYISFSRSTKF